MKHQLLLLALFSMILCSPFFRKLDEEVTEESCKKLGKKYKEVDKYECKTGGSSFIVDKKDDCKKGTWTQTQCSAQEIKVDECSGTPKFTETATEICILGNVEISSLTTRDKCEVALVWTGAKCSISGITDSTECTKTSGVWTPSDDAKGTCTIGTETTKSACESTTLQWNVDAEGNGSCSDGTEKTKNECEETHGVFSLTEKDKGSCSISGKTDKDSCESAKGEWIDEHCSVTQFNSVETCKGTPKFTKKGECKLGETVISSRITRDTCEVALKVEEASCSNKEVKKQADCEAEATATQVKVGECGDDISSNSNFLKAINFALFAICLLF